MGRVTTNTTAAAIAREQSRAVLPGSPVWESLEPNGISSFGAETETVARSPISKNRQRSKGTVVDLDSGFEYEADLTMDAIRKFGDGLLCSSWTNEDLTFRAANTGATGWTIPAATAAQGSKIQYTAGGPITLVYSRGYANAANNGLFALTADTASTGTLLARTGLVTETAPANAEVSVCGIRCEAGDLAISITSGVATLTSNNNGVSNDVDFTTLGLTVGQRIHVGGLTNTNRFAGVGPVFSYGSGRIRTIAATTITLDKLDATLVDSDGTDDGAGGTLVAVDLLFGRFVRNVAIDNAAFLEQYYQIELEYPNLFETDPPTPVAQPDGYEYALGNLLNSIEISMPQTDKATFTANFVGTTSEAAVDGGSRKTNASTPLAPLFTEAMNTSADFLRLRVALVDDTGITSDFADATVTINNNVEPEKVLGTLGAKYLNLGNLEVDFEATALFTDPAVSSAIRNNTTLSMDWTLKNADGAVAFDIPSCTAGNGTRQFPVNESVKIEMTLQAFQDSTFGSSMSISLFPVYP